MILYSGDIKVTAIKAREPKFAGDSWIQITKTIAGIPVNFHFKSGAETDADSGNTYFQWQSIWYRIPNKEWSKFGNNGLADVPAFKTEFHSGLTADTVAPESDDIVTSTLPGPAVPSVEVIKERLQTFEEFKTFIVVENVPPDVKHLMVGQTLRVVRAVEDGSVVVLVKDQELTLSKDFYRAASDSEIFEYFTIANGGWGSISLNSVEKHAGRIVSISQPGCVLQFSEDSAPFPANLIDVIKSSPEEILASLKEEVAKKGLRIGAKVTEVKRGISGIVSNFVLTSNGVICAVYNSGGNERTVPAQLLSVDTTQLDFPLSKFTGKALMNPVSTIVNKTLGDFPCNVDNFKEWGVFVEDLECLCMELKELYNKSVDAYLQKG